jgi:hypothetical protein
MEKGFSAAAEQMEWLYRVRRGLAMGTQAWIQRGPVWYPG